MCYAFVSNQKPTSAPSNKALVPGSRHSSCALIKHMCFVCWCLYMQVCKCVMKMTNINKYKQNRDDVAYNILK